MSDSPSILFVDDEYNNIQEIINSIQKETTIKLDHVSNSRDALNLLKDKRFDVLVIDLQIPESLGGEIVPDGGKKLLEYISQHEGLNKPTHILGITSHIDSYDDSKDTFLTHGWSLIHKNGNDDKIISLLKAKIKHSISPPAKYDIAILTALEHTELEAVRKWDCDWIPVKYEEDINIYYTTNIITSNGRTFSLIATSCHQMGIAQASAIGMKICLKFKPQYIFMTGIAAGIKNKVNLGDILIADICWDWGNGKQTIENGKPKFLSAPRQISIDPLLRAKFKKISIDRKYLDDIYNNWISNNRPETALNIHIGPVATGSFVIEDPSIIEQIQSQHRETIGVEMEAYGLALAAHISSTSPPKTIIIKSVCDFADPEKNNKWHDYAAYTSSQLAKKIIENELEE